VFQVLLGEAEYLHEEKTETLQNHYYSLFILRHSTRPKFLESQIERLVNPSDL